MPEYAPPFADIQFLLDHFTPVSDLTKLEPYTEIDADSVSGVLEEFGRLMTEVWLPTNATGDEAGSHVDGDTVRLPEEFSAAYDSYTQAGWGAVPFAPEYGGGGFPWIVGTVMQEIMNSSNMALAMLPLLSHGAVDALLHHGSEEQKETYLPKMVSGEWAGTMNLTEPDAGSDVGALRTKAELQDDGSYRISGQKIFITFGEHDLTENIVHLVLARTPEAPAGTKGISLFVVPKFIVGDDGSLGERNDVHIVSVEHKLGIKASPTCVLAFGDRSEGAVGYLVGEENSGMRYMFTMMNNARLGVAMEGLGLAERSYQAAADYARERRQGYAPGAARGEKSAIIDHPDVRRQLMTMRAYVASMRALAYKAAEQVDQASHGPDEAARTEAQEMLDLLIPLTKSYCTDVAETVTSIGIQVYGGMGYIEETGVAQFYRDAKITQIYEGTNGIQAMDLVGRKLPMRGGGVFQDQVARMTATAEELAGAGEDLQVIHRELVASLATLEEATTWMFDQGLADPVQALSAATPFQRLCAVTVAGWMLAVQAQAAQRQIEADSADAAVARRVVVTARFFAEHLLPQVHGLLAPVKAGKTDLFALEADDF